MTYSDLKRIKPLWRSQHPEEDEDRYQAAYNCTRAHGEKPFSKCLEEVKRKRRDDVQKRMQKKSP